MVGFGLPPNTLPNDYNPASLGAAAELDLPQPLVFVQMDHACRPLAPGEEPLFKSALKGMEGVVCFGPNEMESKLKGGQFTRWMPFLLRAHACTYHKAQGLTCRDGAVLKPTLKKNPQMGLAYVGISRVTDLKNLIILDTLFTQDHFSSRPAVRAKVIRELQRLRALLDQV